MLVFSYCGCSTFQNHSSPVVPAQLMVDEGWTVIQDIPFVAQQEPASCGHAVAAMVHAYWHPGADASLAVIRKSLPKPSDKGLPAGALRDFFRQQSYQAFLVTGTPHDLVQELREKRPVIVGTVYQQADHYVAHYEVVAGINLRTKEIATLDPRYGWRTVKFNDFVQNWALARRLTLVISPAMKMVMQ